MSSMPWKLPDCSLDLARQAVLMGVLNVTPDSFSDGGQFRGVDEAVGHGVRMAAEGAQIIDVGGESTRPGATSVSLDEELARVIPVIAGLKRRIPNLISIDTSKAAVADEALATGAVIINDVTGGRRDPEMMSVAARRKAGMIVMHMKGTPQTMQNDPQYSDVVTEVTDFFRQQYVCAIDSGIDSMAIAFDPGIGFGKTVDHNLQLLANLESLRVHGRPIVIGVSRKSSLAQIIGSTVVSDRLGPTVVLTALLRERGANVVRVHDVKENAAALRVTEQLLGAGR
jgi:dihydropteroate synthase